MPNKTRLHRFLWISGLAIALILSACASAGPQSTSSHSHTGSGSVTAQVTPMPMSEGPVTYVALGASDAVGIGSTCPGSQGYVARR